MCQNKRGQKPQEQVSSYLFSFMGTSQIVGPNMDSSQRLFNTCSLSGNLSITCPSPEPRWRLVPPPLGHRPSGLQRPRLRLQRPLEAAVGQGGHSTDSQEKKDKEMFYLFEVAPIFDYLLCLLTGGGGKISLLFLSFRKQGKQAWKKIATRQATRGRGKENLQATVA